MAKLKSLIAICLALALVLSPIALVRADGPGDTRVTGGPTDGGDGHPWDDGTTGHSDPGDDDDPLEAQEFQDGSLMPFTTVTRGFGGWIEWTFTQLYTKVAEHARTIKERGNLKTSPKKRGSRRPLW